MHCILQASEEVIEFHASEAYLNLGLTEVHNNDNNNNDDYGGGDATGTISKSLRHYLSNIPGKHKIKEL